MLQTDFVYTVTLGFIKAGNLRSWISTAYGKSGAWCNETVGFKTIYSIYFGNREFNTFQVTSSAL